MPDLEILRTEAERELAGILAELDERHRKALKAAVKRYGRVQDIPEIFWVEMQREIEQEQVAAVALLIMAADNWTTDEIDSQGAGVRGAVNRNTATRQADDQLRRTSQQTVMTLRNRLARKIEDSQASGPGSVGELTDKGLDDALDDVFTDERRRGIAADETTTAFSTGQREAGSRYGGDVINDKGQRVTLELLWQTERDNVVCPRCRPLHDKPESVWSLVFPNGPGPEAHPNCRCSLRPVVIVEAAEVEA